MNVMCYLFNIIFILFVSVVFTQIAKNTDNYGPYIISRYDLTVCSGPRQKNLTEIESHVLKQDNSFVGVVKHIFLERSRIEEMKVDVFAINDNRKKLLWRHKVKDVCSHFAAASLIKVNFKTKKDCVVEKGEYISKMNFTQLTESFLGDSFFYGTFRYHAVSFSKKGNIFCFQINTIFTKKT